LAKTLISPNELENSNVAARAASAYFICAGNAVGNAGRLTAECFSGKKKNSVFAVRVFV